jgi:hypothetical protein
MRKLATILVLLFCGCWAMRVEAQTCANNSTLGCEVPCPAGTSPTPGGTTYDPATHLTRAWQCVDSLGNITLLSASGSVLSSSATALGANVTIPAAGTAFTPATGTSTTLSSGSGDTFTLQTFTGATSLFMSSGGETLNGGGANVSVGGNPGGSTCGGVSLNGTASAAFYVDPVSGCTPAGAVTGLAGVDDALDFFKFQAGLFSITTPIQATKFNTATNCAVNSVSPAACGSAAAGAVVVPTATATYTVNTSAVTAASRIFLMPMSFAGNLPSAPTCVTPTITTEPTISAISTGVSFTFIFTSTVGQTCWQYWIAN